ncbi:hypothetical protein [Sphingobacterium faecale]|uniref:Uncharacterized protein n=1 Tax=Sphingobacterium faecale TaxID=2803775 RepID=A0ABS1R9V0_9SPHI|nr:hypothetical protein [Sphingobacterium faecale]MBL1411500.1 hypothetical protein [Sphingobacterium faecale]
MKTLKSILLGTFIAVGGVALAMNAKTQESICSTPLHEGYIYNRDGAPPEDSNPTNLPEGMESAGTYNQPGGFTCTTNDNETCHWVYDSANSKWIPCDGNYVDLP